MLVKQLSIFVENKFGRLGKIIEDLGNNSINISALSLADTTDFGILRIIVDDPEKAREILGKEGVIAKCTNVHAIVIDDQAGGLAKAIDVLKEASISIEYMYAFVGKVSGKALMVLKTDNDKKAEEAFVANSVQMLSPADIYRFDK